MSDTTIKVTIRVRGGGRDDYGIARLEFPASAIDWSLADRPRDPITLEDVYQVDLRVGTLTDTWDRA